MTAAEALADSLLRARVAVNAHASDRTVKDLLRGFPPRPGLANAIKRELVREGVDVESVPSQPAASVAEHRAARRPKCKDCAEKDREIAALRRALEQLEPSTGRKLAVVPTPGPVPVAAG